MILTNRRTDLKNFFSDGYSKTDSEVSKFLNKELERQQYNIELIASENIVSKSVLDAIGNILTNKYAEGYPSKRYYAGCEFADEIENLAIERLKRLYGCSYANVQPHSGSSANLAVLLAFAKPGDAILGMSLDSGGHLSHGSKPNYTGKWFESVQYGVRKDNFLIDFDQVRDLAKKHSPKLIIAGGSAYPREIDFKIFRGIADEVGAKLWVDMAHFSGLVAAKEHGNVFPYADVVTSTTHKTLRGPRGGIILSDSTELGKKLNSAIFPGSQGGPLMNIVTAKAVAFGEALKPEFKEYIQQVKINAKTLAKTLIDRGYNIITGGTDTHLLLVDLRDKKVKGNKAEKLLELAGITCNKNAIPYDTESPFITSGIRVGTPAGTTRGFREKEFKFVGEMIADVLDVANDEFASEELLAKIKNQVKNLCNSYPIY